MRLAWVTIGLTLAIVAVPTSVAVETTQSHEGSFLSHEPYVPEDPRDPKTVGQREPADPCVEPWREGLWGSCFELETPVEGSLFQADAAARYGDAELRICLYDADGAQLSCVTNAYADGSLVSSLPEDAARVGIAGITGQDVHWSFDVQRT